MDSTLPRATAGRWAQAKAIVADALEVSSGEDRQVLVTERCGSDVALRLEVESILSQPTTGFDQCAETIGAPVSSIQPGRRIGDYEVIREVGRGGMGAVYLARRADGEFDKEVALKLLKRGMDTDDILARFRAERRILARLDHPNIARLLDAGTSDDGLPYFVMEYVEGIPITQYAREHQLSIAARLELFRLGCAAVSYAHRNLVIHRDLKPANALVTSSGEIKLLDFGSAKILQEAEEQAFAATLTVQRVMTPDYASPEQLSGESVTTLSDVYSLGVVLYELLTGVRPHRSSSRASNKPIEALGQHEPERPSTAITRASHLVSSIREERKRLRGDLDNIVLKALRLDPLRRYDSVNQLSEDIRRHLEGLPVLARPDTLRYRAAKFVSRNKVGAAVGIIILLTLLGGIISTTAQRNRAEQQRRRAEKEEFNSRRLLYAAQMNLAYQAWGNANVRRAVDLLEATRPHHGEVVDFREFEWSLLWRLTHERSRLFQALDTSLWTLLLFPDGARIAASTGAGKVYIWDAATGRLESSFNGGGRPIALTPDGRTLVAGGADGVARLWDPATGRLLRSFPRQASAIYAVAVAPDGGTFATGDMEGQVKLLSLTTGEELATFTGHSAAITSITYSPDGAAIATTSRDHTARLWDLASGRELATLTGHSWWVLNAAFAPDGKTLATTGSDGEIRLWDVAQATLTRTIPGTGKTLHTLRFSPDGNLLAASGDDAVVQLYRTSSGERVDTLRGHTGCVMAVVFLSDGKTLVSTGLDGTVRIWDLTKAPGALVVHAHSDWISGIAFSPDSRVLATASKDATVKLWNAATGRAIMTLPHPQWVNRLAFSPNGWQLATADDDMLVRLWDTRTGKNTATLPGHGVVVETVAFSPDGKVLASGGKTGEIKLWDPGSGHELASFHSRNPDLIWWLAFSPDGRKLAVAEGAASSTPAAHSVMVWDLATKQIVASLPGHTNDVEAVAFSPDGTMLASGSWDGTIKLWDTHAWREIVTLKGQRGVHSLDFSPDGKRLVSAGLDETVKIWDVSLRQELCTLKGQSDVEGVVFSPDGQSLAAASKDGLVRIWRMSGSDVPVNISQ